MPEKEPNTDTIIIDGSGLINSLPPNQPKTFDAYANDYVSHKVEKYSTE